jgi:predicted Zn-dependent peptidase
MNRIKYTIHKVNGYTIILVPNDTKTIHINACIKTGSINETKQDAGIHHLVEHILTEALKKKYPTHA